MGEFDEIIEEFLIESQEGLDQLDQDLVALEERTDDKELLARIFRCAHTIKGTSGFLGLTKLEALTHAGETLLSKLRDGELRVSPDITSHLLSMVDAIRKMLEAIRKTGGDGDTEHTELIELLKQAAQIQPAPTAAQPVVVPVSVERAVEPSEPKATRGKKRRAAPLPALEPVRVDVPDAESEPELPPEPAVPAEPSRQEGAAAPAALARGAKESAEGARAPGLESVRVDVELLDKLMDLAGELVLTRNQIMQLQGTLGDSSLTAASQRLNLVTMGLQDGIMRMRMQPIDHVLSKFPRMVRDIARACKKLVRLEMDGKSTELDKTLIESIKDPMTHLIRNAIDHGIEDPEQRERAGKHPEGRILIRASHQSGQVLVEISDDGAGIDVHRVREKAVSRGMLSEERAQLMTEGELINLIFLPGFSTAAAVTNVSGRGVGMDVVKTNVERIGGAIEIESHLGRGTTFRIKVPLTLAIVPALIVSSGSARYAVPQVSLQELVLVDAERTKQRIEQVHGAPVYRLRDKLLPLVFLNEQLAYESRESCFTKRKVHIVVLYGGGRQFGLVVDRVSDQQEIVVKPLAAALKPLNVFAGATILGDGRVVLILDVLGIAQRANLTTETREDGLTATRKDAVRSQDVMTSLLLMRGPDDSRLAVPLERVARLETVASSRLEEAGGQEVLQYGEEIMPVVHLSRLLPERRSRPRHPDYEAPPAESVNLVVLSVRGQHVGIAVHDILDVVDVPLVLKNPGSRAGIAGTLVIQQRVTELLDLDWLVAQSGALPEGLMEAG